MSTAPEAFDSRTCAEDFAGPDRIVTASTTVSLGGSLRSMEVQANRWRIVCYWGFGSLCDGAWPRSEAPGSRPPHHPPAKSPNAEVFVELGGKEIGIDDATYRTPAQVLAAIEAAERDDEAGIRAALTGDAGDE